MRSRLTPIHSSKLPTDFSAAEKAALKRNASLNNARSQLRVGDVVIACYERDHQWYRGAIHAMGNSSTKKRRRDTDQLVVEYFIRYDDGDFEPRSRDMIRLLASVPAAAAKGGERRPRRAASKGVSAALAAVRSGGGAEEGESSEEEPPQHLVAPPRPQHSVRLAKKAKVTKAKATKAAKAAAKGGKGKGKSTKAKHSGAVSKRHRVPPAALSAAASRARHAARAPQPQPQPPPRARMPPLRCRLAQLQATVEARALADRQLAHPVVLRGGGASGEGANEIDVHAWLRAELCRDHDRLNVQHCSPTLPRVPCASECLFEWWAELEASGSGATPASAAAAAAAAAVVAASSSSSSSSAHHAHAHGQHRAVVAQQSGESELDDSLLSSPGVAAAAAAAQQSLHSAMHVRHCAFGARCTTSARTFSIAELKRHDLCGHLVRQLKQLATPQPATHAGHWPSLLYICEREKFAAAIATGAGGVAGAANICGPEHILRMIVMLRRAVASVVRADEANPAVAAQAQRAATLSPARFDEALQEFLHFMHRRYADVLVLYDQKCRREVASAKSLRGRRSRTGGSRTGAGGGRVATAARAYAHARASQLASSTYGRGRRHSRTGEWT